MPSVVQERSFGSVRVYWLDSQEAIRRLRVAAERLIAEHPEVLGVHLFGSLAEGRAIPRSDADVLVLLDHSDRRWLDRPLDYGAAFDGIGLPVELFCYTRAEVDLVPLAGRALTDGVPLARRRA
jgi:predicted nucleotidyltransferase